MNSEEIEISVAPDASSDWTAQTSHAAPGWRQTVAQQPGPDWQVYQIHLIFVSSWS